MKKILALILAMVMLLSFAGCGVESCVKKADLHLSKMEVPEGFKVFGEYVPEEHLYKIIMCVDENSFDEIFDFSEDENEGMLRFLAINLLDQSIQIAPTLEQATEEITIFFKGTDISVNALYRDFNGNYERYQ